MKLVRRKVRSGQTRGLGPQQNHRGYPMNSLRVIFAVLVLLGAGIAAFSPRTASAAWSGWQCAWTVQQGLINSGPWTADNRACVNWETSSLLAATWGDSYTNLTADSISTHSFAYDTCSGGRWVLFAYSWNSDSPDVTYGTSGQDVGEYRDCSVQHGYRFRTLTYVYPPTQGGDSVDGSWYPN